MTRMKEWIRTSPCPFFSSATVRNRQLGYIVMAILCFYSFNCFANIVLPNGSSQTSLLQSYEMGPSNRLTTKGHTIDETQTNIFCSSQLGSSLDEYKYVYVVVRTVANLD